jgi:cytochrome oxidase Cu insertion factor (SCO1/SenC/PrrC family)
MLANPLPPPRPPRTIWIGFALLFGLLGLSFAAWLLQISRSQPQRLRVIGPVAPFTLTNQDSQPTTLADLTNRVWVADIIFTRCAGPCPRLSGQMKSLQAALPAASTARLVTLTTDPEFDTPAVLKKYGERFGADFRRWTFLTGTKSEIAALAGGSLKLSAQPVAPAARQNEADLFIHTTIFVIVDRQARLRGFFETGGDGVDWTNSVQPKLLAAVRELENER